MLRFFNGVKQAIRLNHTLVQLAPLSRDGKNLARDIELGCMPLFVLSLRHTIDCYYHEHHAVKPSLDNALFLAAKFGRVEMLKKLLTQTQYKLSPNIKDHDGNTLYSVANDNGHPQIAVLLADLAKEPQKDNNNLSMTF